MSEYSEISQGINHSGQYLYLENIQVIGGVFSSRSIIDAQFYPLYPGYWTAMLIGKIGHNYPIQSGTYKHLYLAMKVDSGPPDPYPDAFQVFWFADERQNAPGAVWGFSKPITLHPEAGLNAPDTVWRLYKVDLSSPQTLGGETSWTDYSPWQGLRIDPTLQSHVDIQVDWVRLTDGAPVPLSLSFPAGNETRSVWIRPTGTNREILIERGITSPYTLDLQGVPPGEYEYLIRSGSTVIQRGGFVVNTAPLVTFRKPSPTVGEQDSSTKGLLWDFADGSNASVECAEYQFLNGLLRLKTPTGASQPTGCWGGVALGSPISDPRVVLKTPVPFQAAEYRYLSFRMHTESPWQNVVYGMIARWIWTVQGPGGCCDYISHDIPYDVGWQTYAIDLYDAFNGVPEAVTSDCPTLPWKEGGTVVGLRLDPNENILGYPLEQTIDWIRLDKNEKVVRGASFLVEVELNKDPADAFFSYYYTSNPLGNPLQLPSGRKVAGPAPSGAAFRLFLPLVGNIIRFPIRGATTFLWDTGPVSPGTYYVCVDVQDGYNEGTFCSDIPVEVIEP